MKNLQIGDKVKTGLGSGVVDHIGDYEGRAFERATLDRELWSPNSYIETIYVKFDKDGKTRGFHPDYVEKIND